MTVLAVLASKPVVGSSRNNTDGEIMSSMPMLVRFRSPPDTPGMNSLPTCRVFENNNHHSRSSDFIPNRISRNSDFIPNRIHTMKDRIHE